MTQYGHALMYASKELRADREVVLAAVTQDGDALKWASKELQVDPHLLSWGKLTWAQSRWRRLRERFCVLDPIGTYWYQQTMKASSTPDGEPRMIGVGAKRARADYSADY